MLSSPHQIRTQQLRLSRAATQCNIPPNTCHRYREIQREPLMMTTVRRIRIMPLSSLRPRGGRFIADSSILSHPRFFGVPRNQPVRKKSSQVLFGEKGGRGDDGGGLAKTVTRRSGTRALGWSTGRPSESPSSRGLPRVRTRRCETRRCPTTRVS